MTAAAHAGPDLIPPAAHDLLDGVDECACLKRPPAYAYCATCRNAIARAEQMIREASKVPAVAEGA
jgi:hypothetical protein